MAEGGEGEGAQEKPGLLIRHPAAFGVLIGFGLPVAAILPWWVSGDLAVTLVEDGAYPLMPAFATLLLPAWPVGAAVAHRLPTGRAFAAFTVGVLAAASLVGAGLVWPSYPGLDVVRRLVVAASGGPALVGFWVWVGAGLGGVIVLQRRQASRPA